MLGRQDGPAGLPLIRSGQNHLATHSEREWKTRQTEEEVGRQHQEMDRPAVRQVPEGSGEQGKMEESGCEIICGAPTALAVNGKIMMMMMVACPFRRLVEKLSCKSTCTLKLKKKTTAISRLLWCSVKPSGRWSGRTFYVWHLLRLAAVQTLESTLTAVVTVPSPTGQ